MFISLPAPQQAFIEHFLCTDHSQHILGANSMPPTKDTPCPVSLESSGAGESLFVAEFTDPHSSERRSHLHSHTAGRSQRWDSDLSGPVLR